MVIQEQFIIVVRYLNGRNICVVASCQFDIPVGVTCIFFQS